VKPLVVLTADRRCALCASAGFAGVFPCATCGRPASLLTAGALDFYTGKADALPAYHRDERHLCGECGQDEALAAIRANQQRQQAITAQQFVPRS